MMDWEYLFANIIFGILSIIGLVIGAWGIAIIIRNYLHKEQSDSNKKWMEEYNGREHRKP